MGLSIRFYLFAEDGLQSISQRVMTGLIRGEDGMPQYAGTKQKVADVILQNEGKKPIRIERVQGSLSDIRREWQTAQRSRGFRVCSARNGHRSGKGFEEAAN